LPTGRPGEFSRKHLEQFDKRLNRLVLPDDLLAQSLLELHRFCAPNIRVQRKIACAHNRLLAPPQRGLRTSKSPAVPGASLQFASFAELIEFHLNGGIEQPQLHQQLMRQRG
jgi:hypothetical protein